MSTPSLLAVVALSLAALGLPAYGQGIQVDPNISYSATRVMEAGGERMAQQYFHKDLRQNRTDSQADGQATSMIMRADRDQMLMVMPAQRMYVELSLQDPQARAQATAVPGQETINEFKLVGREEVNGISADKYWVVSRPPRGDSMEGHMWASRDHQILVKMDLASGNGRVSMELADLKVGPQPDSLFEVPAGYRKVAFGGGLGGMFGGGAPATAGRAPGATDEASSSSPPAGPDAEDDAPPTFAEQVANDAAEETKQTTRDEVRRGVRDTVKEGLKGLFGR